jgi:regulatory protein
LTDLERIKDRALSLLARREFGNYELKQRLLEKTTDLALVEQVLSMLVAGNLQSDERFVTSYIRRRAAKGFGPLHIEYELKKLKISSQVINLYLASDELDWKQTIKQLFEKKYGEVSLAKDRIQRAKQIRFLQSRGFNIEQINQQLIENFNE